MNELLEEEHGKGKRVGDNYKYKNQKTQRTEVIPRKSRRKQKPDTNQTQ